MASTPHNYHQYYDDDHQHQYQHYQMESHKVQQLRSELAELRECTQNALASSTAEMDRLREEKVQNSTIIEQLEKQVKSCHDEHEKVQRSTKDADSRSVGGVFKRRGSLGAMGQVRKGSLGGGARRRRSLGSFSAGSLGSMLIKAGGKKKSGGAHSSADDDTKSFSSLFGGFTIEHNSECSSSSADLSSSSSDLSSDDDDDGDDVLLRNATIVMAGSGAGGATDDNRSMSSKGDFAMTISGGKKTVAEKRDSNPTRRRRLSSTNSVGAIDFEELLANAAGLGLSSDDEDNGWDNRSQGHLSCSALGMRKMRRRNSSKNLPCEVNIHHTACDPSAVEELQSNSATQSPPPFITRAEAEEMIKEMQLRLRNRSLLHKELERSCVARERKITSMQEKLQNHEASAKTKTEVRQSDHARLTRHRDASIVSSNNLAIRLSKLSMDLNIVANAVKKMEGKLKELSIREKRRDDRRASLVSELKKETKKVNKSRIKTQLDLRIKKRNSDGVLKCIRENLRDAEDAIAAVDSCEEADKNNESSEMKEEVVMEVILQTQTLKKMSVGIRSEITRRRMELEHWRKSQMELSVVDPVAEREDENLMRANKTLEGSELNATLIGKIIQVAETVAEVCSRELDVVTKLQEGIGSLQNKRIQLSEEGVIKKKEGLIAAAGLQAVASFSPGEYDQVNLDQDSDLNNDLYDSAASRLQRNIRRREEDANGLLQRLEQAKKDSVQLESDLARAREVGERTSKIHLSTMKTIRKKVFTLIEGMGSEEQRVHNLTRSIESTEKRMDILRRQIAHYDLSTPPPSLELGMKTHHAPVESDGNSIILKPKESHSTTNGKGVPSTPNNFTPRQIRSGLHSPPPLDMSAVGL